MVRETGIDARTPEGMRRTDVGSTERIPSIDRDACIPCGACSAVCPSEALLIEGLTLAVIPERCRPCGQAALVCPTGALRCPEPDREKHRD